MNKITFVNHTGYTITGVRISAVGQRAWKEDLIDGESVPRGETTRGLLPSPEGTWDVKIVFHDESHEIIGSVKLKAGTTVTLKYNDDDEAVAVVE